MTPADTNRNATVWPLADLFEALRREGFQLRPDDYIEVVQVLDAFQPQSPADLQALIAPLIVISDEEQQQFDRVFVQVWRQEGLEPHAVGTKPNKPEKDSPWLWIATGLLALLAFAYAAFLWPAPTFRSDIQQISGSAGPVEVGDTLVLGIDSLLRQSAGPRARWQWETPEGKPYLHASEPMLSVITQHTGPLTVKLRSQRGQGLLFTTWTDSLRSIDYFICGKLTVIQLDSMRLQSPKGTLRYRFKARIVQSASPVQLTQWQFDGSVAAQNQNEWERTFQAGVVPASHDIYFSAFPDTTQRLCYGEAKLTVDIPATNEPSFTVNVRQTGNLIVPKTRLDQRYYWALWMLGILLVLLIGYYVWLIIHDRQKKEPESPSDSDNPLARFTSDEPPLEIPLENRDTELVTRDQPFYQLIRTLRQPTESEIQRLNVARTMQATMREGGFPSLVFQPRLTETEYLFLIDRSQVRSQQVALFEYLFRTFVQENVCVERFFFHKTFDLFTNEKQPKGLTLRQLVNTYRQHTLIIWSNGYPLLYPPYPVVEPAIREALTDWESRAILTPVLFADWGSKERALQADFLLLPADLTGQLRLIQALQEKQTHQDTYLRQQTDELYSTEYVEFGEVEELRDYLGEDLLQWLAALAVYPRIRWEIVVEMGRALMPPEAVNFTSLLKLARISWMHEGTFPDYTRLELLKVLQPRNEVKARQALLRMLNYAEQYFPGKHFYDGEKYLLQTVNQFTLYAHDAETFADYQSAQQAFKELYEKGVCPDGAMLRYLENPNGNWATLLPSEETPIVTSSAINQPESTPLQSYLDNLPAPTVDESDQPIDESIKRDPKRIYIQGAILLSLLILAGVWYVSFKPQNQVIDPNQPVPITIMLDPNDCVTAQNTSATDGPDATPARWAVSLNDSLYSISNLRATRSFPITNLTSGNVTDFNDKSNVTRLQSTVAVTNSVGEEQSSLVRLTRDTLRVQINCQQPSRRNSDAKTAPTVYIQYASSNQIDEARRLQTRLKADGFAVPGIELRNTFRDSTQVRYFSDQDRSMADSVAQRVKIFFKLRTVQTVKVKSVKKAPIEVWLNYGNATQPFICQSIPKSWISQFDRWEPLSNELTGAINISRVGTDFSVRFRRQSPNATVIDYGKIKQICQQNGVYLIQTANRISRAFLVKNVTRTFCDLAVVNLNTSQFNGPQGQAYFEKLLQSASFRRYTPLKQTQKGYTSGAGVVTEPTNQVGNNPAIQQAPPSVNQTNMAVQTPIQSATDNLRIESGSEKNETVQKGIDAYRRGQYADAITFYDQFLVKNSNSAYVLDLKGYAQFKLRQYDQAVNTLLAATKADPDYAWAYFDLARVYCALGRSSEADLRRVQAITIRPDMQTIMQNDQEFMNLCGRGATAK